MNERNGNQPPKDGPGNPPSATPVSAVGAAAEEELTTGIIKTPSDIITTLGLNRGKPNESGTQTGDMSTKLAQQRTDLAMSRSYLAADRTLMAWIRTALSMISFGFTIGKIGQVIESVEVKGAFWSNRKMMSVESIAYFLILLGTASLLGAAFQHWTRMRLLRAMGLRVKVSLSFIVALVLAVVGGFALSALVLAL